MKKETIIILLLTLIIFLNPTISYSQNYNIPEWIKNNAKWWAEGLISDQEYLAAIEYLIKTEIINPNDTFARENNSKTPSQTSSDLVVEGNPGFLSNARFINGLYAEINLEDATEVFRHFFFSLDEQETIYPTENYFYFQFPVNGKTIWGTMTLPIKTRDDGNLGFGYGQKVDKLRQPDFEVIGGGGVFSAKDGVFVEKINDFNYNVTFEGKTVHFILNDIGLEPPKNAVLRDDEIFVGPSFDESGLKFFLVYNKEVPKLYWILNEDAFVPESFTEYSEDIAIGDRTEFAFYLDRENNRKILIGVAGLNVFQNNWYDGPFDQLPDNYVHTGKIEVRKYIESSYPGIEGKLDKYGYYLDEEGIRFALSPYYVYFDKEELSFISYCKSFDIPAPEFYSCITQPYYDIPEDLVMRMYGLPPE